MARSVLCTIVRSSRARRVGFEAGGDAAPDGRVDARPCLAPVGHDEDGDAVDDACDLCPHVPDLQANGDADGLGDACDLDDTTAQQITHFEPYLGERAEWIYYGPHTYSGHMMHVDALTQAASQDLIGVLGRDRFELAGHVDATDASKAQVAIGVGTQDGLGAYYCELYEEGPEFYLAFTYTEDNVAFTGIDSRDLVGPLAGQDFILSLDLTPPTVTCRATWRGAEVSATGMIPPTIAGEILYTAQFRIAVALRSFIAIHTIQTN